jgi:hypothetical protein
LALLATLPDDLFKDRAAFERILDAALAAQAAKLDGAYKISAPLRKAMLSALSERDETAEICRDEEGKPEPDPELRDYENVPLREDIYAFFDREVKPHVPEAWINADVCDAKDRKVGRVGYEINFNRYFYRYQPPRPLEEIEADVKTLEKEILEMLREVGGENRDHKRFASKADEPPQRLESPLRTRKIASAMRRLGAPFTFRGRITLVDRPFRSLTHCGSIGGPAWRTGGCSIISFGRPRTANRG